ncbi:putative phage baseplate assembly protein [Kribbella rubisoli]|uniref:Phage baseplate assembly protein n=1 Tax=Kribbella rubisoli TaxID=3075929 RepID=A0A4Q7WNS4_9ACTN|nr:putative baseplate assembly protein [Kribbella rubisoli]RZU11353.1 putative phage baseplate assembly protein [Kribbella rubisoli]
MTITGPTLDDRTYEQLREELIRRIPVYTPEWTNHNESDPGIALVELFASLGESLLYRFNQIPDTTKIAFLNLLGVRPRPPQLAGTLLVATTDRPAGVQVLRGTRATAGAVEYETVNELRAWPLRATAAGKLCVPTDIDLDERERLRERRRREDADLRQRAALRRPAADVSNPTCFYRTQVLPDDPTTTEPALDVSRTADRSLWLALVADHPFDASQLSGQTLFIGVAFDEKLPRPFDLDSVEARPGKKWISDELTTDPPETRWELWSGPDAPAQQTMLSLTVVNDSTRGMTTTGVVEVELPQDFPLQSKGAVPLGDYYSPPPMDDPKVAANIIGWLRVQRPRSENDGIHGVRWVGLNAVQVEQAVTARPELLGVGSSEPGQTFQLTKAPVLSGTVRLDVEENGDWRQWTEVETLATSREDDAHFSVEAQTGLVRFGMRSRVPQLGQRVRVVSYRYGGGAAGNVPRGAINALTGVASVTVTNVLPARGGADSVTLAAALSDIPGRVHRRDRAVVAEDFGSLACEVSGVSRADTLSLFHPDTPTVRRAGAVSVVIFPDEDLRSPEAPLPDSDLLRRVATYLDPRRLVTTELYVIPPTYREIAVAVGIRVREGYQVDAVRRWVELLLRQYLAPVPPFGPSGRGWPLGRAVRRAELEAIAVQVDGVDSVEGDLQLARRLGSAWDVQQTVELSRWEIPQLSTMTVVRGTPLPVGTGYTPPPDPGKDPVLVPLPPEVCR